MKKILLITIPLLFLGAFCTGPDYETIENGQPVTAAGADIAFIREGQLMAARSSSFEEYRLTSDGSYKRAPAFFPSRFDVMFLKSAPPYHQFIKFNLKNGEQEFIYATKGDPSYYEFSPNGRFCLFIEEGGLFLLDIEKKEAQQIASQVLDAAWSPDSKSFVYTDEEGRMLIREFNVKEKLNDKEKIYEGSPRAPRYIDSSRLIFEECEDSGCLLVEFDLYRREKSRDFASFENNGDAKPLLRVSPDEKYVAYQKFDPRLESAVIHVLGFPSGEKLEKYEYASQPFWLEERDGLVFGREELDENGNFMENMYLAEIGQDPVLMLENTDSPVTNGAYFSNL